MAEIRMIRLVCPFCVREGKTEAVETPATRVLVPALLERWVLRRDREDGFISLEEAVAKDARLAVLIEKHNGRKEASRLCFKHGSVLKTAKIQVDELSVILDRKARAAERRASEAFDSIGSILSGKQSAAVSEPQGVEPEEDAASAEAREAQEEVQRKLAADAEARGKTDEDGKKSKGGRKRQPYDRSSSRREAAAASD
jgi:hypothetical protein